MLQVKGSQIVNEQDMEIRLRGTCIGGWMNMENFINGYPGDEHTLRTIMAEILGPGKAEFFFDRWLDHFFAEEDATFIHNAGANVVRLPLNYRHFERDGKPYDYLEKGFERLERAIQWCTKNQLYVILDLHAVQGWQNPDWHCDNSSRQTFFWQQLHFQDRFVAFWEEVARRYKGNATVAGFNVMNEPVTNAASGRFKGDPIYQSDWEVINRIYRRVVNAIRAIDPDHIIFLEGDLFSSRFKEIDAPFADNLVYSSHNYSGTTYDPHKKPVSDEQRRENRQSQEAIFLAHQGTSFSQKYQVPLWVGEFGANGECGLDDQLGVFESHGAHWTIWTYKDVGVMGFVKLDPASKYMRVIKPVLQAKRALGVENWLSPGLPGTEVAKEMDELANIVEKSIGDDEIDPFWNRRFMAQHTLGGYVANLMQPSFAKLFQRMKEEEIDDVLQSFALKNCHPRKDILTVLKRYWD